MLVAYILIKGLSMLLCYLIKGITNGYHCKTWPQVPLTWWCWRQWNEFVLVISVLSNTYINTCCFSRIQLTTVNQYLRQLVIYYLQSHVNAIKSVISQCNNSHYWLQTLPRYFNDGVEVVYKQSPWRSKIIAFKGEIAWWINHKNLGKDKFASFQLFI